MREKHEDQEIGEYLEKAIEWTPRLKDHMQDNPWKSRKLTDKLIWNCESNLSDTDKDLLVDQAEPDKITTFLWTWSAKYQLPNLETI